MKNKVIDGIERVSDYVFFGGYAGLALSDIILTAYRDLYHETNPIYRFLYEKSSGNTELASAGASLLYGGVLAGCWAMGRLVHKLYNKKVGIKFERVKSIVHELEKKLENLEEATEENLREYSDGRFHDNVLRKALADYFKRKDRLKIQIERVQKIKRKIKGGNIHPIFFKLAPYSALAFFGGHHWQGIKSWFYYSSNS
jgi:esterase/lipase